MQIMQMQIGLSAMYSLAEHGSSPENGYILRPVQFPAVAELWTEVWPLLEPAVARSGGRLSGSVIFEALSHGDQQLWCIVDDDDEISAAIVTELVVYKTGLKTLRVLLVGGSDMKNWLYYWAAIEDWGREMGCKYAEAAARPGWEKVMKWEKTGIELQKDLTDA